MKKRTLIIYYIVTFLLSIISLYSYKHKSNDFLTATSSLTADFALIISVVLFIYALFFVCDFIKERITKKDKDIKKKIAFSLLILLFTMIIIFISFVNIYSHKNIFEFIKNTITKNENMDIIVLFFKSLFVYFLIYLVTVVGIILTHKELDEEKYKLLMNAFLISAFFFVLKVLLGFRLFYFIIILNIIIYILINMLLNNKKISNH